MAARYDFIIVGGGSAGCALANRLSADPATRVLVLEAGRPDYPFDVYIHMPAALTFPIGNRFYDWQYESGAGAVHERPADLPRPRQGPRRLVEHQRPDLPARQPARLRALGGGSRAWRSWDYAHCLPYFKRMETCLAAASDDPFRGHDGPLVLERGPADSPLFAAFFQSVQDAGYQLTEDVNGYRQEGFGPFDRNIHRGRRLSAARAYLHPVRRRRNLTVRTRTFVTAVRVRGAARGRGRDRAPGWRDGAPRGRRGHPVRRLDQLAPAPAAVGGGVRRRSSAGSGSRSSPTSPASASTCRITSRSTSSTGRFSRSRCSPPSRSGGGRSSAPRGSSSGAGRVRRTTSRAAASSGATTTSRTRT